MPVFHRVQDDVLVVTVDGDFTPGEVARRVGHALDTETLAPGVGVLLDVSGAAGLAADEVGKLAQVFVDHSGAVGRIAVLGEMSEGGASGLEIRSFYRRSEAMEWLGGSA